LKRHAIEDGAARGHAVEGTGGGKTTAQILREKIKTRYPEKMPSGSQLNSEAVFAPSRKRDIVF
jgi:hypothetical protein